MSGGMNPSEVPQMVVITFDDAVNDENWKLYTEKLFPASAKNPNGCPIHATFYVSHEYTNYAMVNILECENETTKIYVYAAISLLLQ